MTVAETIKKITKAHLLENKGVAIGQCLTAVGWVGGTVPELSEAEGLIELSMADVSGGAIAVGLSLSGRRPIYIVRYQGFQWYNAPTILNYAAKSKEMWGIPCPIFVRSISMEGSIGPVAGSSHHGIYSRIPGITICAPMTPMEYEKAWEYFMANDNPVYVSEHRRSFSIDHEMANIIKDDADITILAISVSRLNAIEAVQKLESEGVRCNLIHLFWLKPFIVDDLIIKSVTSSKYGGLLLDSDYENGLAKSLAFDIMHQTGQKIHVLGLEEKTAGFSPKLDNFPPSSERIKNYVHTLINH